MRAELDIPDRLGAAAVDAALEGLVRLAEDELAARETAGAPIPDLYASGVRYRREHGTEEWLTPSQILGRGHGDCEDLASWRAAELRVSGEDPGARARVMRSSPRTWHAIVERGDGTIEDPSRELGMGEPGNPELGIGDWTVNCSRVPGGWQCSLTRDGQGVVGESRYAHDAIARCAELGWQVSQETGEVGEDGVGIDIPIPGLDIASRALSAALSSVVPGMAPPVPATIPIPVPARRTPEEATGDFDAATRAIARRISAIATAEARRKIREARSIVSAGAAFDKREAARLEREKRREKRAAEDAAATEDGK